MKWDWIPSPCPGADHLGSEGSELGTQPQVQETLMLHRSPTLFLPLVLWSCPCCPYPLPEAQSSGLCFVYPAVSCERLMELNLAAGMVVALRQEPLTRGERGLGELPDGCRDIATLGGLVPSVDVWEAPFPR